MFARLSLDLSGMRSFFYCPTGGSVKTEIRHYLKRFGVCDTTGS
jgi:hypothetical protein